MYPGDFNNETGFCGSYPYDIKNPNIILNSLMR